MNNVELKLKELGWERPDYLDTDEKCEEILKFYDADIVNGYNDSADVYFYEETTADGYSVYVATYDKNGPTCVSEDVFYYETDMFSKFRTALEEGNTIFIDQDLMGSYYLQDEIDMLYADLYERMYEKIDEELNDKEE